MSPEGPEDRWESRKRRILQKLTRAGKKLGRFSFLIIPCIVLFLLFHNLLLKIRSLLSRLSPKIVLGTLGILLSLAVITGAILVRIYGDRLLFAPQTIRSARYGEDRTSHAIEENPYESEIQKEMDEPESVSGDLLSYRTLLKQNRDFVGWLTVDGTLIDHPVMYTPYDPEKYLHRSFSQEESSEGLPFIDYRCRLNPDSDNLIIYGHNMKNGDMFATLTRYQEESFYKKHPQIEFDSAVELRRYEVAYAFFDRIYYQDENLFKFYNFIDASSPEEFNEALTQFKQKSIYDTGVPVAYGDHLITLVTCTYQVENGRFVVVAKRVS